MADDRDKPPASGIQGIDPIVDEAVARWKRAFDWENEFRKLFADDTKFANGDSDNGWQWPDTIKQGRDVARRPTLTINKTQQHILRVVNDGRKNKPAPKVSPVGGQATFESAQIYEGLSRHIGYRSKANAIHMDAMQSQVEGGIGYWRINTAYIDDDSFDQEIVVEPITDALSVLLDCDIKQKDGSDAQWGFVFENVYRKEFEREYPDVNVSNLDSMLGAGIYEGWVTKDDIRVAEYYRLTEKADELIWLEDEKGNQATFKRSEVPPEFKKELERLIKEDNTTRLKRRKIKTKQLEWFKIAGLQIVDQRKLNGSYIPIVRAVGREKKIDGKLYRAGLTRWIKDAQRSYNYHNSGQAEVVALQTRSPYMVAAAAIEGAEAEWKNANIHNYAYLTYRHRDENGEIPPPQRIDPPTPSSGFIEGLKIAAGDMELATGQYQPQGLDQAQAAKTPHAINERVQATELATFDFLDNLGLAIAHETRIIIDLAPHVYDTERVIKILGKDNKTTEVKVAPDLQDAAQMGNDNDDEKVPALFNPSVGRYGVEADIGPAFATARQEAWNAFVNIVGAAPDLIAPVVDLMFLNADFPMADEIAKRFQAQLKANMPYLFDNDASTGPAFQALKAEAQKWQETATQLMQQLAEERLKLRGKEEQKDINAYDAETKRLTAAGNVVRDIHELDKGDGEITAGLEQMVRKILADSLSPDRDLDDVWRANRPGLDAQDDGQGEQAPMEGAKKAPDGKWYLPDPQRPGKYLMVH